MKELIIKVLVEKKINFKQSYLTIIHLFHKKDKHRIKNL